ncbi:MAG: hypothetical protein O3A87_07970 [Verrucomicrobia bacterium]|nr:hypothetical protein [Verrucomicrobiota bacterium]MDA1006404.1 hypothetical protein [Verrucomicrobiota bacterium]
MPEQRKNVRRAAVSALRAWAKGHDYAETLVERHANRNNLSASDRALLNSILLAVLRHRRLLDHWIGLLRKGKLDHETRDILRVGICQLLILGIADHAAVNETVECARAPVRGLINAVLRRSIAARKRFATDLEELSPALRHSHPDWLYKRWRKEFGVDAADTLMAWDNQPAPTFLRVNPLKPTDLEIPGTPVGNYPGFHEIEGGIPQALLAGGHVYIQDPATTHAVSLLAPRPGETVLDACAAPGGKAALIATAMENNGHLLCTDRNEKRLPRLGENLANLGIRISATAAFDWTQPAPAEWQRRFDAILLDVPCSNTGVLRRRVDARWRLTPEQINELTQTQHRILQNALPCLAAGGRIVYSTCSLETAENEQQVQNFLREKHAFELRASHQSLPFRDNTDGAYAALIQVRP